MGCAHRNEHWDPVKLAICCDECGDTAATLALAGAQGLAEHLGLDRTSARVRGGADETDEQLAARARLRITPGHRCDLTCPDYREHMRAAGVDPDR